MAGCGMDYRHKADGDPCWFHTKTDPAQRVEEILTRSRYLPTRRFGHPEPQAPNPPHGEPGHDEDRCEVCFALQQATYAG